MTSQQAKEILLLYRPGTADWQDPEIAEAIALARQDQELGKWFENHQAFQSAMRLRLRQIQVPENLKVMARRTAAARAIATDAEDTADESQPPNNVMSLPVRRIWGAPVWLAIAASLVMLLGAARLWLQPVHRDHFTDYARMMVSTALRGYNMECETADMRQLQSYFQGKGTPADYHFAPALAHLQLLGGTALTWRGHSVSMVCFDRADKQKVWLFVMDRTAVKSPPPIAPTEMKIGTLMTSSWTEGDKTYVLAGPPEPGFTKKYL